MLFRTEVMQPVLVAASLVAFERLTVPIGAVAGHSLGELAAWSAAGGIAAEDAVRLARARGLAMAAAAKRHPGGLVVVRGPRPPDGVVIAAHNAPDTWVISGDLTTIRRHGRPLPVSGPWHHPAMAEAADAFGAALAALRPSPLARVFVSNRTGAAATGQDIPRLLLEQLVHPVLWVDCMATLAELGVREVYLCGPGKELASLARACAPGWAVKL